MADENTEEIEDYYDEKQVEELREEDELDDSEEAFMRGYDEDAEKSSNGKKDEYA